MKRSAAREDAFKLLYSLEVQKGNNTEEQINLYFENENIIDDDTKNFINSIVLGIENNLESIENSISNNLKKDWKIERISKVDLVLLKIAVYEIIYTEVPYKVAVNEAVELSKKYGDETSPNFINGVLASIIKESGKAND